MDIFSVSTELGSSRITLEKFEATLLSDGKSYKLNKYVFLYFPDGKRYRSTDIITEDEIGVCFMSEKEWSEMFFKDESAALQYAQELKERRLTELQNDLRLIQSAIRRVQNTELKF